MKNLNVIPQCAPDSHIIAINSIIHSSHVVYRNPGEFETLFHFEEERYTRTKNGVNFLENWISFPSFSYDYFKRNFDITEKDVDFIVYTENRLSDYVQILEQIGFGKVDSPHKLVRMPHHFCHAASAYYPSGFQDPTLVLGIDGWGSDIDGQPYSAGFYVGDKGRLTHIGEIDRYHVSLGYFYTFLTEVLGKRRVQDEGKVVGMAPHGAYDAELYTRFRDLLKIEGTTTMHNNGRLDDTLRNMCNILVDRFGDVSWRGDTYSCMIAYNGQRAFEDAVVELVINLHDKHPETVNLAVGGGIFANVSLNKRLNELPFVKEMFVAPQMSDEGLGIGALLGFRGLSGHQSVFRYNDVYLGSFFTSNDVVSTVNELNTDVFEVLQPDYLHSMVAALLVRGKVIGLFQGASESGPRALGNRSIIADPRSPEIVNVLTQRLRRNKYMPFSPTVMKDKANEVFVFEKSQYAGEFMTMSYDTRADWVSRIPAVIHPIDKTARIQALRRETNPVFYDIISSFNDLTDVPLLLNTSFNVHNEPIIDNVKEALTHLQNGVIDYLVLPPYIVQNKS